MNKKLFFAMLLIMMQSMLLTAQIQMGSAIMGEAANDLSGAVVAVSANGLRVAIGAPFNDGNGENSGHVRVYAFNGTEWSQLGSDINGVAADDNFGMNIAIAADGNTIAVSAPYQDSNGSDAGQIRTFAFNGTDWAQMGNAINGPPAKNHVSLSANGLRMAVSSMNDNDNGAGSGQVRIYSYTGTHWIQPGNNIYGEAASDKSGAALAFSADGTKVAICSPFHDSSNGIDSGQLRIFGLSNGTWAQIGAAINGEAADDQLGGYNYLSYNAVSLSADGTRVAVGAPRNNGNGTEAGHVRVFKLNGSDWVQLGADIDGASAFDHFGDSVSLSADGRILAVGASLADGGGIANSGQVRLFGYSSNNWTAIGNSLNGDVNFDNFGNSISLSADGSKIAIGAYHNAAGKGQVKVYDFGALATTSFEIGQAVIFPNPVKDKFTVTIPDGTSLQKINLYTVSGQCIQSYETQTVVTDRLSKGMYFIEIVTDKAKETKKIIIE